MASGKKITIDLDDAEAAAFDMLRADCSNADPGAQWDDALLVKSIVLSVLEDDLASHHRPLIMN